MRAGSLIGISAVRQDRWSRRNSGEVSRVRPQILEERNVIAWLKRNGKWQIVATQDMPAEVN